MIGTKKTIAMFGGAAALAMAVGFGGLAVSSLDATTAPVSHPAANVGRVPAKGATVGVDSAYNTGIPFGNHVSSTAYNTGIPFGNHVSSTAYNTGIPFGNHVSSTAYNTGIPFGNHAHSSAYNTGIPFGNHAKDNNSSTGQDGQTPTTAPSAPQQGSATVAC